MGMLIDGVWQDSADGFMQGGAYHRERSAMPTQIDQGTLASLKADPTGFVLVASASCPWSHGAVLAMVFKGWAGRLPLQLAGGVRLEGYTLLPEGPLSSEGIRYVHQLYTRTNSTFTGRVTVPVLWDARQECVLSNSSADIMRALNEAGDGLDLCPAAHGSEIEGLTKSIFDGLSNAVYRAGLAERQDEYDQAVDTVFDTLDGLERRLSDRRYLFGDVLTLADIRLFATLVRFDTIYATHFRCSQKRLVDYEALWRFTRRIYQSPGVRDTVDFDEIRFGYYAHDGNHNPFGIIGRQPEIDWEDTAGL